MSDHLDDTPKQKPGQNFKNHCHPEIIYKTPMACPLYEVSYLTLMFEPFNFFIGVGLVVIGLYLFVFGHANSPRHNFLSSYPIIFIILAANFYDSFTA